MAKPWSGSDLGKKHRRARGARFAARLQWKNGKGRRRWKTAKRSRTFNLLRAKGKR